MNLTFEALLTADNVLSDPSTVKVAGLCCGLFVIDIARVHHARIKCDVVFDWFEFVRGIGVVPHCILGGLVAYFQRVISASGQVSVRRVDLHAKLTNNFLSIRRRYCD